MRHTFVCVSAVLVTFGIATMSAAADQGETCVRWQDEIAAYSGLINRNPDNAVFYNNRGNAYWCKHDYDRAIADFGQAIRLDPKDVVAYLNRGDAYEKKRDYPVLSPTTTSR